MTSRLNRDGFDCPEQVLPGVDFGVGDNVLVRRETLRLCQPSGNKKAQDADHGAKANTPENINQYDYRRPVLNGGQIGKIVCGVGEKAEQAAQ